MDTSNVMSTALQVSEDPTLRRLSKKTDRYPTNDDCMDAMMEGTHALLMRTLQTTVIKTQKVGGF